MCRNQFGSSTKITGVDAATRVNRVKCTNLMGGGSSKPGSTSLAAPARKPMRSYRARDAHDTPQMEECKYNTQSHTTNLPIPAQLQQDDVQCSSSVSPLASAASASNTEQSRPRRWFTTRKGVNGVSEVILTENLTHYDGVAYMFQDCDVTEEVACMPREPLRWVNYLLGANGVLERVFTEDLTTYDGIADMFESSACEPAFQRDPTLLERLDQFFIDWIGLREDPREVPDADENPERVPEGGGNDPDPIDLLEEPEPKRLRYVEKQVIEVKEWKEYPFPDLDHVGYHNVSLLSGEEQKYVAERGYFFHQVDKTVSIPSTLVEELSEFWVDKTREVTLLEFSVCTNLCRELLSRTNITASQQLDAVMYAPALSYLHRWSEKSNIARVVAGDYVHSGWCESKRRFKQAWARFKHLGLVLAVSFVILCTIVACFGPWTVIEPNQPLQCAVQPLYPHISFWHPSLRSESCSESFYAYQTWIVSKSTVHHLEYLLGCYVTNPDFAWYWLSDSNPSCFSYSVARFRFLSRKAWNKLMHSINGNRNSPCEKVDSSLFYRGALRKLSNGSNVSFATYILENCANLPRPKKLKPGAKIRLCEGELRGNLRFKTPQSRRGRQFVYGFDTKSYSPTAFAGNQHNEEQALYARVLADTILATDELPKCVDWILKNERVLFHNMRNIRSVDFETYLSRSNASPSVKRTLRATMDRLKREGISENSDLGQPRWRRNSKGVLKPVFSTTVRNWTTRSSFVKVENNLYDSPLGTKDKAPRLIQGATPEFVCLVGPWVMAVQDVLKRRWGKDKNNIVFTSGMTGESMAQAFTEHVGGRILEDDLGKFDCSIRMPWCEMELTLFKRWGAPLAVLQLVEGNMYTHGYTTHGWKYSCDGTRKSGDPFTSLMNSVINGLSHEYLYCKWTKRSARAARETLFMLVQGDDNCLWHQEPNEFPWRAGMATLGFDSKATYRSDFGEIEFCSCRLYKMTGGYVFGPKPGKVLAKFGYIINPPANVSRESMMRGVALGLKHNCSFIPPLKVVIDRVLELTEGHRAYFERNFIEHSIRVSRDYVSNQDIDFHLYKQYYWCHSYQAEWAKTVSKLQLGDDYCNPLSQMLFDRDTSGPAQIFGASLAG